MPHCDSAGLTQHIVFGLADAFPNSADAPEDPWQRMAWREDFLHRGAGECLLRGEAAKVVEEALLQFDGVRYALRAWCVMPNHVHVLALLAHMYPLSRIVHSWKSYSANRINTLLGRTGRLWRREYYNHFVRDDDEYRTPLAYIENNPVSAGLVSDAAAWRWSSAYKRRRDS